MRARATLTLSILVVVQCDRTAARTAEVAGAGVGIRQPGRRSCRIRPIAASSSSSSRTAASAPCAAATVLDAGLSRSVGGDRRRRRAGAARPGVPAGRGDERPVLRQLHQPLGRHRRRAVPALEQRRGRRSRVALRSALGRRRRAGVHRAAVREPQRRPSRVRSGRLSSTSASATAARATIPIIARRIRRSCSARCCASTSTCRTAHPTGYQVPRGQSVRRAARRSAARPEIWAFGLRNPWRYSFDDPARGGTGALRDRRRRPEPLRGDRLRAGEPRRAQLRLAQPRRARTTTSPRGRRRTCRWSIRSTSTTTATGQSITGGYVYRGSALPASYRGPLLLRRLRAGPRLVDRADDRRAAARRARRTRSSTPPSSAASAQLGNVSSFGVDADGELYLVELLARPRLQDRSVRPPRRQRRPACASFARLEANVASALATRRARRALSLRRLELLSASSSRAAC